MRKNRWRQDCYRLFDISLLSLSSAGGWFSLITESNCFAILRCQFHALGHFEELFSSPGGGIVNLDFFKHVVESECSEPCVLLGKGSFHQIHGGVATNVNMGNHSGKMFADDYRSIRDASCDRTSCDLV